MRRLEPVIRWLGGRSLAAGTFGALIVASVAYRVELVRRLVIEEVTPFSFVASPQALISLAQHLAVDALFAGVCAGIVRLAAGPTCAPRQRIGRAVALGVLGLWGLACAAHYDMMFALHEGLSWEASTEGLRGNFGMLDIKSYATVGAYLLGTAPLLVFAVLRWHPVRWSMSRGRAIATLSGLMLLAAVPARFPDTLALKGWQPKTPLRRLPLIYWLADAGAHFTAARSVFDQRADALSPLQANGVHIIDPAFGEHSHVQAAAPNAAAPGEWNVLVAILESVSDRRAFQEGPDGAWPIPMPFLLAKAREGLWLTDHRSTSNSSARSIFSILSGLYPRPHRQMFCTRPNLAIPSLASWLKPQEAFLVTPSRLQSYFPRSWLATTGLAEQYGFDELPASAVGRPQWTSGRNELDAVDFFIERMARAKDGFLGVYYSYAPHYHYYDYGPDWVIAPNLDNPLHRYVNNLRLLDAQLERLFEQLRSSGRLDRTVVLLVGDHGEAFGEHEGNWTHSRHSFEENLHTPAIVWQPDLIPAGRVATPTSHVDLVPTLLSALGRPAPTNALQGEVQRPTTGSGPGPGRAYTFTYGNEDTLTSVRSDRRKLQWRKAEDSCRVFELSSDAEERSDVACPQQDAQLDALLRFDRFQRALLPSLAEGG